MPRVCQALVHLLSCALQVPVGGRWVRDVETGGCRAAILEKWTGRLGTLVFPQEVAQVAGGWLGFRRQHTGQPQTAAEGQVGGLGGQTQHPSGPPKHMFMGNFLPCASLGQCTDVFMGTQHHQPRPQIMPAPRVFAPGPCRQVGAESHSS